MPIFVLLVGFEELRQSLIQNQPSVARIFELVEIMPWNSDETRNFYEKSFERAGVTTDGDALDTLSIYAGGLPVLAHEIGDATYKEDQDNHIDDNDAVQGILTAAEIVGRKYLQPQVFQAIRSANYKNILRKLSISDVALSVFTRREIREILDQREQSVFDNFIRKMKDLGVIESNPEGGAGSYRFCNVIHRLYFRMEAKRKQR